MDAELELERAGLVATDVRAHVLERDGGCCRVCGQWVETPALHHIVFRSQGGLDVPSNLIAIGWQPFHDCHLTIAHGPKARFWRQVFLDMLAEDKPWVTALQYARWTKSQP